MTWVVPGRRDAVTPYGTWGDPRPAVAELRRWLDEHPRYTAEPHDVARHQLVRVVDPEGFDPALPPT